MRLNETKELILGRYADLQAQVVSEEGLTLFVERDFHELRKAVSFVGGDIRVLFDNRRSETNSENGFWIKGLDRDGNLAHVQAARRIDLAGESLNEHFAGQIRAYTTDGFGIDPEKSEVGCTLVG